MRSVYADGNDRVNIEIELVCDLIIHLFMGLSKLIKSPYKKRLHSQCLAFKVLIATLKRTVLFSADHASPCSVLQSWALGELSGHQFMNFSCPTKRASTGAWADPKVPPCRVLDLQKYTDRCHITQSK